MIPGPAAICDTLTFPLVDSGPIRGQVAIAAWGYHLGGAPVASAQVDREFGLAEGTLESRTGIASLARAGNGEGEAELARKACESLPDGSLRDVSLLLATSETNIGHPGLAAKLHGELGLPACCAAMDVGGGCAGMLNAFSVAQAMIASRVRDTVLVVASEVHSRWLRPDKVTWKLGALFGDGACAFLLRRAEAAPPGSYRVGDFIYGCEPAFADTIRVGLGAGDSMQEALEVDFRGLSLADAVLNRLAAIVKELESRLATARERFSGYAIHQPNPRLVEILARQLGVSLEKIPEVARTAGNLGSATCGVSLCRLLSNLNDRPERGPVVLAAMGPGLLWAGAGLVPA
jgi:3-oxoacyl-[acyl-carrier-protein] synthase-3